MYDSRLCHVQGRALGRFLSLGRSKNGKALGRTKSKVSVSNTCSDVLHADDVMTLSQIQSAAEDHSKLYLFRAVCEWHGSDMSIEVLRHACASHDACMHLCMYACTAMLCTSGVLTCPPCRLEMSLGTSRFLGRRRKEPIWKRDKEVCPLRLVTYVHILTLRVTCRRVPGLGIAQCRGACERSAALRTRPQAQEAGAPEAAGARHTPLCHTSYLCCVM